MRRLLLHTTLIIGSIIFAFPFVWLVSTSFKADREIFADPPEWIPRLPYHVQQTPYIADREYRKMQKPRGMSRERWQLLQGELTERIWQAARPQLPDDALRTEQETLRRELVKGIWGKVLTETPETLWQQEDSVILDAVFDSVTQDKVNAVTELIYRGVAIGAITVQDLERNETLAEPSPELWDIEDGNVQIHKIAEVERSYVEIAADYRKSKRHTLNKQLPLPVPLERLRSITLAIRSDESYHKLRLRLESGGQVFEATKAFVLNNYLWQDVTWQLQGEMEQRERENIRLRLTEETSDVPSGEVRIVLTLERTSYLGTLYQKSARSYFEASVFVPFWLFIWNTVKVTALSIVAQLLSCSLVAYAFARLRWPGRDWVFLLLLSTMMLPPQVTMIPVFLIMRKLGFYNTLEPLWIGSLFGSAFYIFLLRQFFMGIPTDLEDAAKIDGCSFLGIYWRIMLPLIKPALAAIAIFQFMGSWNDFMGPLIYISERELTTLSLGLQLFQSAHSSEYGMMMATSTVMTFPVIAVFFFAQKYFIQGVTLTGMKN